MTEESAVLYWDTSALLSYFFSDSHSVTAREWEATGGVHLISSLAHAEACAVVARMGREGVIDAVAAEMTRAAMRDGRWRRLNGLPDRAMIEALSRKWPLRGADLWHLAMAVSLKNELPELKLLSFDDRLNGAATGEDLISDCVPGGR